MKKKCSTSKNMESVRAVISQFNPNLYSVQTPKDHCVQNSAKTVTVDHNNKSSDSTGGHIHMHVTCCLILFRLGENQFLILVSPFDVIKTKAEKQPRKYHFIPFPRLGKNK